MKFKRKTTNTYERVYNLAGPDIYLSNVEHHTKAQRNTRMKENDGGKSVVSRPEMKIARMIDDGIERCFVSLWLGVRKNVEHYTGIKGNDIDTTRGFTTTRWK